ncbi:hypothetical protein [Nucisporomicrobium flavum]|uniref:hypothetical protein n=1 Tax=Nucisporomicrobium flavum TaxID=2785915 RepID=UPI0018F2F733|nr:hypothetical protein [Nucisporomicrobium flavum]
MDSVEIGDDMCVSEFAVDLGPGLIGCVGQDTAVGSRLSRMELSCASLSTRAKSFRCCSSRASFSTNISNSSSSALAA